MQIAENIKNLIPYKPGKPISETQREYGLKEVVKLASNENPLGTSEKVLEALKKAASEVHRYPDPSCFEAVSAIGDYFKTQGVSVKAQEMAVGNGSNELIDLVIRCFCQLEDHILIPKSSFIAYSICAKAANIGVTEVPLTSDLKVDLEALYETWSQSPEKYKIIFLPNPNNPTGQIIEKKDIQIFLDKMKSQTHTLVIFDEAYFEFVRSNDYENALTYLQLSSQFMVLRTFSKVFGLAGLRLGVLVGCEEYIGYIHRIRNPFNVNHLAQAAVISALKDKEYLKKSQEVNWQGLDYFYSSLEKLGLKYWPSEANFVLFDTQVDSLKVYENLLKKGVILRPVKGYGLLTHLRMSVGLPQENEKAISALKEVL